MNTKVKTKEFETSVRKWAWEQAIIIKERELNLEGTEKVSLQLFKELNLHIACILFGYVQIFCTLMP